MRIEDSWKTVFRCPSCGHTTTVLEARSGKRRRECVICNFRYTTYEIPAGILDKVTTILNRLSEVTLPLQQTLNLIRILDDGDVDSGPPIPSERDEQPVYDGGEEEGKDGGG